MPKSGLSRNGPTVVSTVGSDVGVRAIYDATKIALSSGILLVFPVATLAYKNVLAEEPENTLSLGLLFAVAIQFSTIYLVSAQGLPPKSSLSTSLKKKRDGQQSPLTNTILALVLTGLLVPFVHVLYVLFGAPVTVAVTSTTLLSAHTAVLALFPLLCTVPLDINSWLQILGLKGPWTPFYTASLGTLLGAWLGAVPIPLDWDRSWQRWPVTIIVGAYAGNFLGALAGSMISPPERKVKGQ
ncbi:glycosylphosphatidylinositol anchor biosynthesis protein 11 [Lipomyces oligophaga]|uniref:glycosylphosphatidylinositol anchor biosynthesis protein 11 n=1 Tax=Lipomyces oligophaga TaxID=45792 RepID=UPI0034CDE46F